MLSFKGIFLIAQTQAQPVQEAVPIQSPPSALVEWSILVAAVAWFGRQVWAYFLKKEDSEASLQKDLITNLQDSQAQLLKDNRQAQLDLIEQIQLKESITKISAIMQHDLQRHLVTTTTMFGDVLKQQVVIDSKLDALHKRLDFLSNANSDKLHIPLGTK